MNIKIYYGILVALFYSTTTFSADPVRGTNTQIVTGNCNIVYNAVNAPASNSIPTRYCRDLSATKDTAIALTKIERYIEASNPTKLQLSSANIERWGMDEEDYLTLNLSNVGTLPAYKVTIQFLAPVRSGEKTSRQIKFTPSKAIPIAMLRNLSVESKDTLKIPVAPVSELAENSRNKVPADYDLIGAGTGPDIPEAMSQKYIQSHGITDGYSYNYEIVGLAVQVSYGTIFGGNTSLLTGVYLYFGKVTAAPPINAPE